MLAHANSHTSRYAIWPPYRRTLCSPGNGLAGFNCAMDGMSGAGRLGQTALFFIVQIWTPPELV